MSVQATSLLYTDSVTGSTKIHLGISSVDDSNLLQNSYLTYLSSRKSRPEPGRGLQTVTYTTVTSHDS